MTNIILETMAKSNANSVHEMGMTVNKDTDFNEWYQQLLIKAQLINYYDVSGCYVLLPNSYGIWEQIQKHLDIEFKKMGVKNVYFPLFITKKNLEMEKSHIEGFTPEVAWVTKSGSSDMIEPLAVRPTSECAIYPILPNLIRSHHDLPLKFNQWCNVVRWEFKDPVPFIRSREFLWNEGHTSFATQEESMMEVKDIIDVYQKAYSDLLAVPVIKGMKTENEKFAGAVSTHTIEAYIPYSGKGVQAATAHCLGQNFSKMFGINFQDKDEQIKPAWQNSWGFTTRSIGIMLMTHGDNKGAVMPPRVAPIQIVIIPIPFKNKEQKIMDYVTQLHKKLNEQFRVHIDNGNHKPGWKFNYWETMGVPLRIEVGPRDVENKKITMCKRTDGSKSLIDNDDNLIESISELFLDIHDDLYKKASKQLFDNISLPTCSSEFVNGLNDKKLCLIRWCHDNDCELKIKDTYKAKPLCMPLDWQLETPSNITNCIMCGQHGQSDVLFGRSF